MTHFLAVNNLYILPKKCQTIKIILWFSNVRTQGKLKNDFFSLLDMCNFSARYAYFLVANWHRYDIFKFFQSDVTTTVKYFFGICTIHDIDIIVILLLLHFCLEITRIGLNIVLKTKATNSIWEMTKIVDNIQHNLSYRPVFIVTRICMKVCIKRYILLRHKLILMFLGNSGHFGMDGHCCTRRWGWFLKYF